MTFMMPGEYDLQASLTKMKYAEISDTGALGKLDVVPFYWACYGFLLIRSRSQWSQSRNGRNKSKKMYYYKKDENPQLQIIEKTSG